jgi:ArsR family transcriptional regulator
MAARRNDMDDSIYRLHADLCSTLANPKRLKILNVLRETELSAADLLLILEVPKANLSQHMSILRQKGVVTARKEGTTVYYRLARPKMLKAFDLMRTVLFEVLEDQQRLLKRHRQPRRRRR